MHTDTETLANALAEIARLQAEVNRQEWVIRLWRDFNTPKHDIGQLLENIDPDWPDRFQKFNWTVAAEHYAQEIVEAALGEEQDSE